MLDSVTIVLEPCEEGGYTAYVPEIPGAISEGETEDEAVAHQPLLPVVGGRVRLVGRGGADSEMRAERQLRRYRHLA